MLYHLISYFYSTNHFFNHFLSVNTRMLAAFISSIAFSFLFANRFIEVLKKQFPAKVSNRPPKRHLKKNNTPTMGGIFILFIVIINTLLWNNLAQKDVWIFLLSIVCFGLIGFLDDFKKIIQKNGIGLSARFKFVLQLSFSFLVMTLWYWWEEPNTTLCIPFFKIVTPILGLLIIPWGMFIIIATSNAVNLTDGLDGLVTGSLISNFSVFSLIAYSAGNIYFSHYLSIPFTDTSEIAIIGTSLIGVLLSFLWYNAYPAQVFMGDVGSLALGAGLALMALMTRQELLLPLTGAIFVLETISVIIQVFSYKYFGKRLFRMAPIHHHYELLGSHENKITIRFWIISIIFSVITLFIFFHLQICNNNMILIGKS